MDRDHNWISMRWWPEAGLVVSLESSSAHITDPVRVRAHPIRVRLRPRLEQDL
jgi:hypothetical protein